MRISTYEHDGVKYPIELQETSGDFSTTIDGERIKADTLEKLKQKIARSQRKKTVKLALLATVVKSRKWNQEGDGQTIDVLITGIHARNRVVLYRRVTDKKADTVEYSDKLFKRLSSAEHTEYAKLLKAKHVASDAVAKFIETHEYSTSEIEKQVATAEQAAGLEPEVED
jgi:predicted transcriptional regulator